MHVWPASRERCGLVILIVATLSLLTVTAAPAAELLVSSNGTEQVQRYEGTTGAFLNAIVAAGSGELRVPTFLIFRGVLPTCVLTAVLPGLPTQATSIDGSFIMRYAVV